LLLLLLLLSLCINKVLLLLLGKFGFPSQARDSLLVEYHQLLVAMVMARALRMNDDGVMGHKKS